MRAGHDDAGLVRHDDRLRAVAQIELREDAADMGLDRVLAQHELGGDLGIRMAARDQSQNVELPCSEAGELLAIRRSAGSRGDRELLDETACDRGSQQRVPCCCNADRIEQTIGRRVLQKEAARTEAERVVHIALHISLTNRGRALTPVIRGAVEDAERDWAASLGKERFAQLRELLAELNLIASREASLD